MRLTLQIVALICVGAVSVAMAQTPLIDIRFEASDVNGATYNYGSLGGNATVYNGSSGTGVSSPMISTTGVSGTGMNFKSTFTYDTSTTTSTTPSPTISGSAGARGYSAVQSGLDTAKTDLNDFTMILWYQGVVQPSYTERVVYLGDAAANSVQLCLSGSKFVMSVGDVNTTSIQFVSTIAVPAWSSTAGWTDTTWKFIAISYSYNGDGTNSQATFYSGTADGTLTNMGTVATSAGGKYDPVAFSTYTLGNQYASSANGTREFTGNMDNFSLYDSALSQSQIQSVLTAQVIPEPSFGAMVGSGVIILGAIFFFRRRLGRCTA